MDEQYLEPLVSGEEIKRELRRRKSKSVFKTIQGASKNAVAEKVKLEEAEGWHTVRKNARSTRMAKDKPMDEQLEDEVWTILAQMGFKEMSQGRQFKIAVKGDLPARQIDVYAKDDETAIIAECTQKQVSGKKSMAGLIEKIKANRQELLLSIQRQYGAERRLKVKFLIATRNISWSDVDLNKCKEAEIAVISDEEIDYYAALVRHLKQAARYQFLGHMFEGQKIERLKKEVVATRGQMGGDSFYTFLIRPDHLLKIAYVGHKASRDIDNLDTYQRMLQPKRLNKIADYINDGGKFATNIVINFKSRRRSALKFDAGKNVGNEAPGVLHLPANYASAWIIDGQHRLYGYAYARDAGGFQDDSTVLPVLAYDNLPPEKEMKLFIDINSKQVKVNTGLLVELYADLHWKSPDVEEAFEALSARISSKLNSIRTSPLYERMVVTGKKKTSYRCLTQTSIKDGVSKSKLLGSCSQGSIVPGPLSTSSGAEYEQNLKKAIEVLSECLGLFAHELSDHWRLGDAQGGYLCTNNGIRAIFHVIQDIAIHIRQSDGTDLCFLDASETVEALRPYLMALVKHFREASPDDILAFRNIGSSLAAVRRQAHGMEVPIHAEITSFEPPGFKEYIETRDEAGTTAAQGKLRTIHERLFIYVVDSLKSNFGQHDKAWWIQGIPKNIRQKCVALWEEKNREGEEESNLNLIDYIDICQHNWELFKDCISLGEKDKENKRARTKWIKELNDIRQIITHPERGALTTERVEFVDRIYQKVEECFPKQEN